MNNLFVAWGTTFLVGIVFLAMDVVFLPFFELRGVPALSVIGGVLILLGSSSIPNWIFKIAWSERSDRGVAQGNRIGR